MLCLCAGACATDGDDGDGDGDGDDDVIALSQRHSLLMHKTVPHCIN